MIQLLVIKKSIDEYGFPQRHPERIPLNEVESLTENDAGLCLKLKNGTEHSINGLIDFDAYTNFISKEPLNVLKRFVSRREERDDQTS